MNRDIKPENETNHVHHPAIANLLHWFGYEHLPPALQATSKKFHDLAHDVADNCLGAEATVALRKLLEAKDAAVRATVSGNPLAPKK